MNNENRQSSVRNLALVIVIAVVTSIVVTLVTRGISQGPRITTEQGVINAKERVHKTKVIRAAYAIYPPASIKNPNTGEISGICVDVLEKAAENLGFKVEWTEEVPWGNMIAGLQSERYDMIGSAVWANASRAKGADFSIALYYNGVGIYARANDDRFPNGLASLRAMDESKLKISVIDGEMSDLIAQTDFPKAQRVGLPQLSEGSQLLLEVATGKADITFVQPFTANEYLQANPGSVKNISPDRPIRVFPVVYMVKDGEYEFRMMLDVALEELVNFGFVNRMIEKYAPDDPGLYRVA